MEKVKKENYKIVLKYLLFLYFNIKTYLYIID